MVVDDDASVLSALRRALVLEGYQVATASDGEAALDLMGTSQLDLLILDVMLPGIDGFTVCSRARELSGAPILMLTAKDTVPDRVSGLDHGADDYLVKPFAIDELMARVRALLRRQAGHSRTLQYEDLVLDLDTHEVFRGDEPLSLSPLDFQLLTVFLQHPRQVLSREQLCQQVWGFDFEGESNFVNVAVMELRRKIASEGRPRLIQTVRGFGYALRAE